jgi:hypothetical protein
VFGVEIWVWEWKRAQRWDLFTLMLWTERIFGDACTRIFDDLWNHKGKTTVVNWKDFWRSLFEVLTEWGRKDKLRRACYEWVQQPLQKQLYNSLTFANDHLPLQHSPPSVHEVIDLHVLLVTNSLFWGRPIFCSTLASQCSSFGGTYLVRSRIHSQVSS